MEDDDEDGAMKEKKKEKRDGKGIWWSCKTLPPTADHYRPTAEPTTHLPNAYKMRKGKDVQ